jgi:hypothetical protein
MIFTPPQSTIKRDNSNPTIFLAGSIEMGKAENWQHKTAKELESFGYDIFNPRRDDWDSSWEQKIENPQFYQQVNWELEHIEKADYVIMYLSPGTQSPISLLELGLLAKDGRYKLMVVCPEGFWRKGNVDIICSRYNIRQFDSLEDVIDYLRPLTNH